MKQAAAWTIVGLIMSMATTDARAAERDDFLAQRDCRQLVVVVTDSWGSSRGTLTTFERPLSNGSWRIRRTHAVVVGKKGLAWGLGIAGESGQRMKHEGDNKAPAGAFVLGTVFGYAATADTAMPYRQVTPETLCVDDAQSSHYNRLIDCRRVEKDWSSAEVMRRNDDLYKWGVIVEHNSNANRGFGSCIFLHIWRGPDEPTVGCTAMAEPNLVDLIRWLDRKRNPLLVQLPRPVFRQYQDRWRLPQAR